MEIRQLQLFAELAQAGSLSKVSASRGMAQSVLSKHIAQLEEEFGGKLFHRTGRGVVLTEFGRSALPRVSTLLEQFESLRTEIREQAGVPSGPVKLAVQASVTQYLVGPLFQRVRADYPQIELRLMEGFSGSIEEALANGRADIGMFSRYGGKVHKSDEELSTEEMFLIGPAGSKPMRAGEICFADVAQLPLVLPGAPDSLHMMLAETARRSGVQLKVEIEVDSLTAMKEIVAGGAAFTILTRQAVQAELASGRLQASRIVEPVLTRTLVLAITGQRPLTHAGRTVLDLIRKLHSLGVPTQPSGKAAGKPRSPLRAVG